MNAGRVASVILLSGGLDSAANLFLCQQQDTPVLSLTFDYGQRAAQKEIQAAKSLSAFYGVPHQVLALPWLGKTGQSALTDIKVKMPAFQTKDLDNDELCKESSRDVWVPNRNGVFIHIAAAFAESLSAKRVIVGFNSEEAKTFPDNSIAYMEQVNRALLFSTRNGVEVFSYTADWDKKQIVQSIYKMQNEKDSQNFFETVWSCYEGGAKACGHCESCQRFSRAIQNYKRGGFL